MSHPPSLLSPIIPVLHAGQTALAAYAAQHSYEAITRVQKYESQTKQAAQYSDTADRQLKKTRTTQAAGAGAVRGPQSYYTPLETFMLNSKANEEFSDCHLPHLLDIPHHRGVCRKSYQEAMAYQPCHVRA